MPTEARLKKELASALIDMFPPVYERIMIDVAPARTPTLVRKWQELWAPAIAPKLQPDIDLLYKHVDGTVTATEVKFFRKKGNTLSASYYEDFSQALALLLFGSDKVSLLYAFDYEIFENKSKVETDAILRQYGGYAWTFIRERIDKSPKTTSNLGSGLDFTCIIYDDSRIGNKKFKVTPLNFRAKSLDIEKRKWGDLEPLLNWKYLNPFRHDDLPRMFRASIMEAVNSKKISNTGSFGLLKK